MIYYRNHNFYDDDKPILLMAGEVHYFRLPKSRWSMHLDLAKSMGLNTIATYVPWIGHVEKEGELDFGKTDIYDIDAFFQLAKEKGLYVFLRPGPYVMAELMNEGIPEWIFEKYPDIKPKTIDGKPIQGPIVDYLHPGFLHEVHQWYAQLLHVIRHHLQQNGGPIIGIQLDNEIGMLPWVSKQSIASPYFMPQKLHVTNPYQKRLAAGSYEREYYLAYAKALESMFVNLGVKDMNYFINIHGTSHGRGKTFPLGISQLMLTWQKTGMIPGTDVYFGNLSVEDMHDYYIIHEFLEATLEGDQPLTSLEFNCGDGNFGDNLASRTLPSAADFKLRMNIAQGYKMINYYLLTGGFNPKFKHGPLRGNPFIAITGERHGYAAPIQPDGSLNYTYHRLARTTNMMTSLSQSIGKYHPLRDEIAIAFISDSYMTTIADEKNPIVKEIQAAHEFQRNGVVWDTLVKHLILLNYQIGAIDFERVSIDPNKTKLLIVPMMRYMAKDMQLKLIDYHKQGGKLILAGECPTKNLLGEDDTSLLDYLGISSKPVMVDWETPFMTLKRNKPIREAQSFRSYFAQVTTSKDEPLFQRLDTQESVGILGQNFVLITSSYPGHLDITQDMMDHLHMPKNLILKGHKGHLLAFMQGDDHPHLLHLFNLDHFDQEVHLSYLGKPLFHGKSLHVFAQDALMLPIDFSIPQGKIIESTAELLEINDDSLVFRLTQIEDEIRITSQRIIAPSPLYTIHDSKEMIVIKSTISAKIQERMTIYFQ
ncbi:MAG: hypothetical protein C4537_05495 [Acholeplasma sp.]|jgi:beta-galactosidase|nr:MAG: hypothetical protein C4537_05495 [Acholeplasma sp.]